MTSKDMYLVVNDEQSFRLYVVDQFGKMNTRMDKLESRMDTLESRMTVLEHQQDITNSRIELSMWFTGICFGVLALVIAFVGIFAPKLLERRDKPENTPAPAPAPTVITLPQPQVDINAIARQVGEIFGLTPKN